VEKSPRSNRFLCSLRSVEMTGWERARSVKMTDAVQSLLWSIEVFFEILFDLSLVTGAEISKPTKDEAVVQGEKLQPNDAWKRQPGIFVFGDGLVTGPRTVVFGGDHCKHGVAGSVEFAMADHQCRPPFTSGLF